MVREMHAYNLYMYLSSTDLHYMKGLAVDKELIISTNLSLSIGIAENNITPNFFLESGRHPW